MSVLVVNAIGIGSIVYGWHVFKKADEEFGACHIKMACNYDDKSDAYRCESECNIKDTAYEFMEGVALMAVGAVYEAAANVFTYIFDGSRRDFNELASPESILKIRNLLNKSNARAFANEYLAVLPQLVQLGIFPEDEVESYKTQLLQCDHEGDEHDQQLLELSGEGEEDCWYAYKQRLLAKIPSPIAS